MSVSEPAGAPYVRVTGLRYESNGFALGPLSFALDRGQTLAVMGPNGSGKTTLLRLLAGLEKPAGGRILLGERELTFVPTHRRRVGLVFQELALFPHRTVRENVGYGLRIAPDGDSLPSDRVDSLLEEFHLTSLATRYPSQLSGGEQQRVAVARTLAPAPELVLFDEPLSAADRLLRRELAAEVRAWLHRTGTPAVYVTHDVDEGLLLADRLALLEGGRWVQEGTPEEVFAAPANEFVASFLGYNVIDGTNGTLGVLPSSIEVGVPAVAGSVTAQLVSARRRGEGMQLLFRLVRARDSRLVEALLPESQVPDDLSVGREFGLRWTNFVSIERLARD